MHTRLNLKNFIIRSLSKYKTDNSDLSKLLKEMPRENKKLVEAHKHRNRIKEKGFKYIPGNVNLQVLGNGSYGSPGSIYLFTDQTRYVNVCYFVN